MITFDGCELIMALRLGVVLFIFFGISEFSDWKATALIMTRKAGTHQASLETVHSLFSDLDGLIV